MNDYLNFDLSFPLQKFVQEGQMNQSLQQSISPLFNSDYMARLSTGGGYSLTTPFDKPLGGALSLFSQGAAPSAMNTLAGTDATSSIGSGQVSANQQQAGAGQSTDNNPELISAVTNGADQVVGGVQNAITAASGNSQVGQAIGNIGKALVSKAASGAVRGATKYLATTAAKDITAKAVGNAAKAGVKNAFSLGTGVAKAGNIMGYVGLGAELAGSFLKDKTEYAGRKGNITKGMDAAYDAIATGVSFIPGVGQIIGGSMAVAKLLNKGMNNLGAGTDGMTTTDAVLGSNFFGWNIGAINGAFGSRAHTLDHNDWRYNSRVNAMRGSYAGIQGVLDEAREVQGKKYGLFSDSARKSANSAVALANTYRDKLNTIYGQTELGQVRGYDMASINGMGYANAINGGYNQKDVHIGRQGMKLSFDDQNNVEEEFYPDIINWTPKIQAFQNGGELNVIPEGALHARKHHMENDDNITKKGIPVVDNDGKQQAEIEVNEIIFRKEVTEKIEQLAKDGSDDAAIECGKLLAEEIIENTDDRTGLIASTIEESDTSNKDNGELVSLKEGQVLKEDEQNNEKVSKKSIGGKLDILRELSEMPAEKLEELSKILKYLNQ